MAKLSRDEQMIRAAKIRALITAFLNADPLKVFSTDEICKGLQREYMELGYTRMNMYSHLAYMADQGLINRCPVAGTYTISGEQKNEVEPRQKRKTHVKELPPSVSVEIIKSTGKVRLSIKGLVIEIGVVDE